MAEHELRQGEEPAVVGCGGPLPAGLEVTTVRSVVPPFGCSAEADHVLVRLSGMSPQLLAQALKYEHYQNVSTVYGKEADESWRFTDAAGHEHSWAEGDDPYPTLVERREEAYDESGEPYGVTWLECRECGKRIRPGTKPKTYLVGGRTHCTWSASKITGPADAIREFVRRIADITQVPDNTLTVTVESDRGSATYRLHGCVATNIEYAEATGDMGVVRGISGLATELEIHTSETGSPSLVAVIDDEVV